MSKEVSPSLSSSIYSPKSPIYSPDSPPYPPTSPYSPGLPILSYEKQLINIKRIINLRSTLKFRNTIKNLNDIQLKSLLNTIIQCWGFQKEILIYYFKGINKDKQNSLQNMANKMVNNNNINKNNKMNSIHDDNNDSKNENLTLIQLPNDILSKIMIYTNKKQVILLKNCCYKLSLISLKLMVSIPIKISSFNNQYYCKQHYSDTIAKTLKPASDFANHAWSCVCNTYRFNVSLKVYVEYINYLFNIYF